MVAQSKSVEGREEKKALKEVEDARAWIINSLSELEDGVKELKGLGPQKDKIIDEALLAIKTLKKVHDFGTPDVKRQVERKIEKRLHSAAQAAAEASSQDAAFSYLNQFVYKKAPLIGNRLTSTPGTNRNGEYLDALATMNDILVELYALKEQAKPQGSDYRIVSKLGTIGNKAAVDRVFESLKKLLDTSNVTSGVNAIRNLFVDLAVQEEVIHASAEAKNMSSSGVLVGGIIQYLENYKPSITHARREHRNRESNTTGAKAPEESAQDEKTVKIEVKIDKEWSKRINEYIENVLWAGALLDKEENKALRDALHSNSLTEKQSIQLYKLLMKEWAARNTFASGLVTKIDGINTAYDMVLVGRMGIKAYLNQFTRAKLDSLGFSKEEIALIVSEDKSEQYYFNKLWKDIQSKLWLLFNRPKKLTNKGTGDQPPPLPSVEHAGEQEKNGTRLEGMLRLMPPPAPET